MARYDELFSGLRRGDYDSVLTALYSIDPDAARRRAIHLMEDFGAVFDAGVFDRVALFSSPGRTEIGGNHTDHQRGRVLCAGVDLDMLACAAPNDEGVIRIHSKGYPKLEVYLDSLLPQPEEKGTSEALVRGIAARIKELGYPVGGLDACITSEVLSGSGLSSSAAYEVLVANIFNHFFCGGELDAVEMAKIGQYAENVYFGKPCGLMDQMACSVGGVVFIDFADPAAPVFEKIEYDFAQSGYALCIIDTGSCHADLTEDYAEIPREMSLVAGYFGKNDLRDVPQEDFLGALPVLREKCGDRAVLRAMHFYEDDARAAEEAEALKQGKFAEFLNLVNASGLSSFMLLQNIYTCREPQHQAVSFALAAGSRLLGGTGAIRVHGGGFAGTIQAFVPMDRLESFRAGMENLLGRGACYVLNVRSRGGCVVIG